MDKPLKDCLPLKVTGKIEIAIKDKDGVTIAKHLTREDAEYIVSVLNNSATLTALLKEAGEALDTGQAFVLKMFEVYDDPQYLAAFSLLADHQGAYSGKTWTKEQNEFTARAAEIRKKIQEVMG